MSFLSELFDSFPKSAPSNWTNFENQSKDYLTSLVPSVIVTEKGKLQNLIEQRSDITGYVDDNAPVVKCTDLNVKLNGIGRAGFYTIELSGVIYNMESFLNDSQRSKLFIVGKQFDLFYGWAEHLSILNKVKFNPYSRWLPCTLSKVDVDCVDYKTYEFKLIFYSGFQYIQKNISINDLNIKLSFGNVEIKVKDSISSESRYCTLQDFCEELKTKYNSILITETKEDESKNYATKIDFDLSNSLTKNISKDYFKDQSNKASQLKLYEDNFRDSLTGTLMQVFDALIDNLPTDINQKINVIMDEKKDKIVIKFYNSDDEFSKDKIENNAIRLNKRSKNSLIKSISFSYEQPIISIKALKDAKENVNVTDSNKELITSATNRSSINIDKLDKQPNNSSEQGTSQSNTTNYKNEGSTKPLSFAPALLQYFGIRVSVEVLGFCQFYPGQNIYITGDPLFGNSYYIVNDVVDNITNTDFTSKIDLLMIRPNKKIITIFG